MLLALLLPDAAHAATRSVTFCAYYQVDFDDSDFSPDAGDDYYTTNSDKKAYGVKIKVVPTTGSSDEKYSSDATGCAQFDLDDTKDPYEVRIVSTVKSGNVTLNVKNDDSSNTLFYSTAIASYTVTTNDTLDITTANTHQAWNASAAAGYAVYRRDFDLGSTTVNIYTDDASPPCGTSCSSGGNVWLTPRAHPSVKGGDEFRFVVAHELGHALAYWRDEATNPSHCYYAAQDNCLTDSAQLHEMNSKEFQSAAAVEGFAHAYAAVAFNNTTELDCGFMYYKSQDYDLDTSAEAVGLHRFSCELGPEPFFTHSPPIDSDDYLGDMCNPTLTDRATEMDWLRFWWDFVSEESTIDWDTNAVTIWDNANPRNWDPDGPGSPTFGCFSGTTTPYDRLETEAGNDSVSTEWANHSTGNGVTR